jgi:hypothetical protein
MNQNLALYDRSGTIHSGATISMFKLKALKMWRSSFTIGGHLTPDEAKIARTWKKSRPILMTAILTPFWLKTNPTIPAKITKRVKPITRAHGESGHLTHSTFLR